MERKELKLGGDEELGGWSNQNLGDNNRKRPGESEE